MFCEWCNAPFTKKVSTPKRFCTFGCAMKYAGSLRRGKPRPDASIRMLLNNPMSSEKNIAKMVATKSRNGTLRLWKGERWGNGTHTPQQLKLQKMLGPKWVLELAIPTGVPRGQGYPTCYKVDIGRKRWKIAVEIDGKNHRWKKPREKDRKKETHLSKLGWSVLRFTNEEIDKRPSKVVRTILRFIASK